MRSILTALQEGRLFELPDTVKPKALEFLARILDANPDIEIGTDAIEEIHHREQEYNTGIGLGVAVPHVRARREEGELYCAIGWSPCGIDYGAADHQPVHLVFMYYIPGAQKNVYLKEISSLVKAITKTGGIEPIQHASHLNVVRHLLLDWVSEVLGESGPEAVARMIKLEVKQAQGAPTAAPNVAHLPPGAVSGLAPVPTATTAPAAAPVPPAAPVTVGRATPFSVLVLSPTSAVVLSQDAPWAAAVEKENRLSERLSSGAPFQAAGRTVYVTGITNFPPGRMMYTCVALIATGA